MSRNTPSKREERWIVWQYQAEEAFEKLWVNQAVSLAVIAGWWILASSVVWSSSPLPSLQGIWDNNTLLFSLAGTGAIAVGIFWHSKDDTAKTGLAVMAVAWLVMIGVHGNVADGTTASSRDGEVLYDAMLALWRWHPSLLAGWYGVCACHTLVFIFRNTRAKLKHYWGLFLSGFLLLAIGYLISPGLASLIALTTPHEWFTRWLKAPSEKDVTLRGSKLTDTREAKRLYRQRLDAISRKIRNTFLFGGLDIPSREAVTHVAAIGSAGSGKTITLKLVMKGLLPMVSPVDCKRALIFDPKCNAVSDIMGIPDLSGDLVILNPFDARCVRYDVARDFGEPAHARTFAELLIPEPKENERGDRFFRDAAVLAVTGVVELFQITAPGQWRLSDVVRAFSSERVLMGLLGSTPETACYVASFGSEKTSANILASVLVEVNRFRVMAALSDRATSNVSIRDWLEGGQIWLLGENPKAQTAMNSLNALIVARIAQELLSEPDTDDFRTLMVMDELQSIRVAELEQLAVKGRSKGVSLVVAFQSIQGMYRSYGKELSDSMLGQFRHKAFLKMSDFATAEWASQQMGEAEVKRSQATTTWESGLAGLIGWAQKTGGSQTIQQTRTVLASELMKIQSINPATGQGLTGYYVANDLMHKHYEPWGRLKTMLPDRDEYSSDYEPVPPQSQRLAPWTAQDWARLGITEVMCRINDQQNNTNHQPAGGRDVESF